MSWVTILIFILTNGPSLIRLIIEIRGLLKDLKASDQQVVMEMCLDDVKAYKIDKDKDKLMNAIKEKHAKFKTMESKPRGRKNR